MTLRLLRTYNDFPPDGIRRPAATYEIEVDGEVVGHVGRYEITVMQTKKYTGVSRKLATGKRIKYTTWRARLFGRVEGPQRNTRKAAVAAVLEEG